MGAQMIEQEMTDAHCWEEKLRRAKPKSPVIHPPRARAPERNFAVTPL
jgi:hypothetical protein